MGGNYINDCRPSLCEDHRSITFSATIKHHEHKAVARERRESMLHATSVEAVRLFKKSCRGVPGNKIRSTMPNNVLQDSLSFSASVCGARYPVRVHSRAGNPWWVEKMGVVSCADNSWRRRPRSTGGQYYTFVRGW